MKKIVNKMINFIRFAFCSLGFSVVRTREFESILNCRNSLLRLLIEQNIANHQFCAGATGIVFSKDRALQLFTFLHSYVKCCINPPNLVIIYSASSHEHLVAYREVESIFSVYGCRFKFVCEALPFNKTLVEEILAIFTKNIFFIVDDNVCIAPFDGDLLGKVDSERYILSLRMSPNCTYSYTTRASHSPPKFNLSNQYPGLFEFMWNEKPNEWSYPCSLDGHVFPTVEIRILAVIGMYKSPNSFENLLMSFADYGASRLGLCFSSSRILNLPINKVQNENNNFAGSVSVEDLLKLWNAGFAFDVSQLSGYSPSAPHEEHNLPVIKRDLLI
ncbi:MAG: hypothetical protein WCH10_02165 [bacterium]